MTLPSQYGVEVLNIDKIFEDVHAVDTVSFNVSLGSLYSLLGPNGAGKTTTINMLSCNMKVSSGDAIVMGYSIARETKEVKKYIGICPQENILYEYLTVYENLIFFGEMYDVPSSILKERAKLLIEKVGLKEKRNSQIRTLSGGQKRRVNLIVGMIHDPQVLFLDEPTAGLDPQTRRLMWDYIQELKNMGKTIILTTHYMDEADILSDKVGIMDHGKIIAEDTPKKLKESIGKGDNLIFRLNGTESNIKQVIKNLVDSKVIITAQETIGDEKGIRITALDGIGKIGRIIKMFLDEKVAVEDITIQANSLENVFLALTGRTLRE